MNGDLGRLRSSNDVALQHFCSDHNLQISELQPQLPSYHHFSGKHSLRLDLAIQPSKQENIIDSIILDPQNASTQAAMMQATYCRSGNNSWDLYIVHIAHFVFALYKSPAILKSQIIPIGDSDRKNT